MNGHDDDTLTPQTGGGSVQELQESSIESLIMAEYKGWSLDELIEENLWEPCALRFKLDPQEAFTISSTHGWTRLHWLCSIGSTPIELLDLVASLNPDAITQSDTWYGDTPLHICCRNSQTHSRKVALLLERCRDGSEGVLRRNRFGGSPLHSASNHNAVLEVLQALVKANPLILKVTTFEGIHAVSALWHSYIQTIPGNLIVAGVLRGESPAMGGIFQRFWQKVEFLASEYFRASAVCPPDMDDVAPYVLHGLLSCNVPINLFKFAMKLNPHYAFQTDSEGNLPLHVLVEKRPYRLKEKEAIIAVLGTNRKAASVKNANGDQPLVLAIRNKIPWENGLEELHAACTVVVQSRDPETSLYPFQLAASVGGRVALDTTYNLLRTQPDLLFGSC